MMKRFLSRAILIFAITSSHSALAEYTCTGIFVKKTDEYDKGYQTTVYDYFYKNGDLLYGIPKTGYIDAKFIKLDKNCILQKLERRIELETVQ